ncbi:MAG: XRE family transcriptional regulator [Acutalibacteraceae bacterium]|nr:XRE family transcriptional regulator [Acutalibacteraceae bacterium]
MLKKPTDELMNEINQSNNIDKYLKDNSDYMLDRGLSEILESIIDKKGLKKSLVIKKAEISEVYGYQIFSGVKKPLRDKLLSICIAMELTLEETQDVLKHGSFALLYPKNKRDSIIIFGIDNKMSVCEINNLLYDKNEDTL